MSQTNPQKTDDFDISESDLVFAMQSDMAIGLIDTTAGLKLMEAAAKNATGDMVQTARASIVRLQRDIDAATEESNRIDQMCDLQEGNLRKAFEMSVQKITDRRMEARTSVTKQNAERSAQIHALHALIGNLTPASAATRINAGQPVTVAVQRPAPVARPAENPVAGAFGSVTSAPRAAPPVAAAPLPQHATAPAEKGAPAPMTPAAAAAVASIQDGK